MRNLKIRVLILAIVAVFGTALMAQSVFHVSFWAFSISALSFAISLAFVLITLFLSSLGIYMIVLSERERSFREGSTSSNEMRIKVKTTAYPESRLTNSIKDEGCSAAN